MSSLPVRKTDAMLHCSYSAITKLPPPQIRQQQVTQSRASFSIMNRDGRIRNVLGAAAINHGLSMSAEENGHSAKTVTTHMSHTWSRFLGRCCSSRRSLEGLYHEAGKQLFSFNYDPFSSLPMGYGKYAEGNSGTPFAAVFLAVFNSILEVFLLCSAGYILASRGILDKRTQKQFNRLNTSLFTPVLLFSKWWYLKSYGLSYFLCNHDVSVSFHDCRSNLGMDVRFETKLESFMMATAMFMNSNVLPIALMQSLVVTVPDLAWGPDDSKNGMLGWVLTYLTMYGTFSILCYSYGTKLLSKEDPESAGVVEVDLVPKAPEAIQPQPSTETMVDLAYWPLKF
ncbi:hypothetical protein K443DRAFT_6468 [Laccaria amethystina LaAM-08-1]|uniref:Uncharacterized protein n=1 Tax=Laccaria amethystina LaAM-08-1 TaxID=1095629 RepID=A0A0C9XAZ6_9AGAR|nr:hypothetical protein K443DRAFT_6468 [Laccaria amethystina LaAM-08-1]